MPSLGPSRYPSLAASDLTGTIATNAGNPQAATTGAGSVTARSSADVIAADRYGKAAAGAKTKRRGLRFSKLIPAGACPDSQGTGSGGLSANPNAFAGL